MCPLEGGPRGPRGKGERRPQQASQHELQAPGRAPVPPLCPEDLASELGCSHRSPGPAQAQHSLSAASSNHTARAANGPPAAPGPFPSIGDTLCYQRSVIYRHCHSFCHIHMLLHNYLTSQNVFNWNTLMYIPLQRLMPKRGGHCSFVRETSGFLPKFIFTFQTKRVVAVLPHRWPRMV